MRLGTALAALTLLCQAPPSDAYAYSVGAPNHHQQQQQRAQQSPPPRHAKSFHIRHKKKRGSLFGSRRGRAVAPLGATAVAPVADSGSRRGWPRRLPVIGRIFRRKSLKMRAVALSVEEDVSVLAERTKAELSKAKDKFIQQNMERMAPAELFEMEPLSPTAPVTPTVAPLPEVVESATLAQEEKEETTESATPATASAVSSLLEQEAAVAALDAAELTAPVPRRRYVLSRPLTRLSNGWVENVLTRKFDRWTKGQHENMAVQLNFKSGFIDLVRGKLQCDASIDADRIVFNPIRMSGGRIEAQRLALNLFSFLPDLRKSKKRKRFPNQFDFVAEGVTLTQEDLIESPCIRNGLRRLLTRILKVRGTNAAFVKIDSITVLPSGKLSCLGTATTIVGARVPFEVRTGLGMAGRGHVLTFPGLELSLSPGFDFFMPILPDITVDLGHNAQLRSVKLDGKTATLQLSARVTITPEHTVHLPNYRQPSSSYSSPCSVDVGRWLTRLGQFSL